ncbi:MAG: SDR family oxidoreductase [Pseudomonadota bacterium]
MTNAEKRVVIIGANRGIGYELCKQYVEKSDVVIATCRTANEALKSLNCDVIEGIDVADDESIEQLGDKIKHRQIDILIHNAGILASDHMENIDFASMRRQFEVNSLGPLRTILALKDKLGEGSKVGIVSSRVGSIDDNDSSNNYGYRASKTAVNMIGKCLSIDLKPKGVAIALLHPGYVRTEMTHHRGLIEADESAAGLIARIQELTLENTGCFVHTNGEVLPW